jgi:hypothetical protein
MPLGTFLGIQSGNKVWRVFKILVETLRRHVLMAGLAGFAPDIVIARGGWGPSLGLFLLAGRFGGLLGWRTHASRQAKGERKEENCEE